MADIKSAYSNYVKWTLKSTNAPTLEMQIDPGGWDDDSINLGRHKTYHGILTTFTNSLIFYADARDYIIRAFKLNGINEDLRLTKYILRDIDGEVKWVERYSGLADFNELSYNEVEATLVFNSNQLEDIIKSHESDEFEIEREDSIDGVILDPLVLPKTKIKGRELSSVSESVLNTDAVEDALQPTTPELYGGNTVFRTKLISQGEPRFVSVDRAFSEDDFSDINASNMFFVDDAETDPPVNAITLQLNINEKGRGGINKFGTPYDETYGEHKVRLVKFKYNESTTDFDEVESVLLSEGIYTLQEISSTGNSATYTTDFEFDVQLEIDVEWDEGLAILHEVYIDGNLYTGTNLVTWLAEYQTIQLNASSYYDPSPSLSFIFIHDLFERLFYILTGKKKKVLSRIFGRTDIGYEKDGDFGFLGFMSGFWVRAFDPASEKYKSLTTSLKNLNESVMRVLNVGIGIETIANEEVFVIEDLKHFYREKSVIRLPNQINLLSRKVDSGLYFSGIETGYSLGGDYENEIGLDEPNTKSSFVTPIRKSKNKFQKVSRYRADEYGMEIARRKPQLNFPDEDTRYDEHIWWLDLKKQILEDGTVAPNYEQKDWDDRLQELPTGVHSPETFRSMLFTPLSILFRHGWVLRAGMEQYRQKFIKFISGVANTTLGLFFIGDDDWKYENEDVVVDSLERSRFETETVVFEHPVDDDLMDLILGKTTVLDNGVYVDVPNFYFKFEYTNEDGEIEKGYLMELKPQGKGQFTMMKTNEKLL